jgi:hypothetical protein
MDHMVLNCTIVRGLLLDLAYSAAARARGAKLRLRSPWNFPSGSATGAPAPERRVLRTPEAVARRAFLALPVSWTLSVCMDASPPVGLKLTLSV